MNKAKLKIILPGAAIILATGGVLAGVIAQKDGSISANSVSQTMVTVDAQGNTVTTVSNADGTVTMTTTDEAGNVISTTVQGTSTIDTGNLTAAGSGLEGTVGTGKYNYGEALQKSLLFYELQRSGDLPEQTRCNWRGDSCLTDGADNGVDLSGGWYDAGDNVKFNLPMSYTASMLAWSLYEDWDAYEESGQLAYALGNVRWANEYFIKCHPEAEVYYYQVGSGSADHAWWGPAEFVDVATSRPSYKVTKDAPGSTVTGGTAASLASCAILFAKSDADFSAVCLEHAKSLFTFAEATKSDAGYTEANGFYTSNSGFYDELSWAAVWLYLATGEETYLQKAKDYYAQSSQDYIWCQCWDDVHYGAGLLLAKLTGEDTYKKATEKHLDWWSAYSSDDHITYTPKGLAWLDSWGSLRYASTASFLALSYAEYEGCDANRAAAYKAFAESQCNYILGDTGFSYLIGFGEDFPKNPHHRTAQGSYCNNMNEPAVARHILYGALVGGPDANDGYEDTVSNYVNNEVACDYNAGFTGLLAKMYKQYKGQTLKDFGAVEMPGKELFVEGGINVEGQDFVEIKAYVYNMTAWPARSAENLELRYYIDLSEVYAAGGSAENIEITTNYMQGGSVQGIKCWDEENHIYYLAVDFAGGGLYPGGQEHYKQEIQVRLRNAGGAWDNSNDPSFVNMQAGTVSDQTGIALYDGDVLVYGTEPPVGEGAGKTIVATEGGAGGNNNTTTTPAPGEQKATSENVSLTIKYDNMGASASSIPGTIKIKNTSDGSLDLSALAIEYYFTKDGDGTFVFECYHSAMTGADGSYSAINKCTGTVSAASGENTDAKCVISFGDAVTIPKGGEITVQFALHRSDWANFNTTNDYSGSSPEHIVVTSGGKIILGTRP